MLDLCVLWKEDVFEIGLCTHWSLQQKWRGQGEANDVETSEITQRNMETCGPASGAVVCG